VLFPLRFSQVVVYPQYLAPSTVPVCIHKDVVEYLVFFGINIDLCDETNFMKFFVTTYKSHQKERGRGAGD